MGDCFDWKRSEEDDEKCSKCLELNLHLVVAVDLCGKAFYFQSVIGNHRFLNKS